MKTFLIGLPHLCVIYVVADKEEGSIISSQERAVQPYYRDEDYLKGYCLDYEAEQTFRTGRVVRFTGSSKAIFDELNE